MSVAVAALPLSKVVLPAVPVAMEGELGRETPTANLNEPQTWTAVTVSVTKLLQHGFSLLKSVSLEIQASFDHLDRDNLGDYD